MALFSKKQPNAPRRRRETGTNERASESSLAQRYAFHRNRTLTGSSSSSVTSSNEANSQLKSPRVQAHELVRQRRHIGSVLLLVLVGAALLYALIAQFTAGVVVRVQDVSTRLDPVYEQAIQDYLSSQPIERLRFLLSEKALGDFLQTAAPEVATVRVEGAAGFGKSEFVVTMRQPIAGWSMNGRQQYVDNTGTAFSRNYFASPKVQIVDNSGIQVDAGQAVASNRFLGFVGRVVGLAKGQGYVAQQVVIPTGTTRQVEVRLEGVPYPIKFSVDRAAGEQVEDMARSLKWLSGHGVTPQYLDVRVSGKAFYK
jgi:hypothetical protein